MHKISLGTWSSAGVHVDMFPFQANVEMAGRLWSNDRKKLESQDFGQRRGEQENNK